MTEQNTPPEGEYCWASAHTGSWDCPECAKPEPQSLTFGPVTFSQRGPFLRMIWKPGYSGITGHVLSLDELEKLHKMTCNILESAKGAPKVGE